MKQFLPVVWWLTATLVIAFVLVGLGYLFADALLLGVLFLPGMLTARYFVPQLSFENRRQGILDTVYLALAILGIEYLSLMLGHAVVLGADEGGMPGLLLNPPFILLVLTALIAPEIALEKHLERRCPYARSISFVSDPPARFRPGSPPTAAKSRSTPRKSATSNRTTAKCGFTPPGASPTAPKPAFRNGRHSWTAVSCASTARSSSTRRASTAAARHTWRSAE